MNWLKDLLFAESWSEFAQNLIMSAVSLVVLWVLLVAVMIFFEAAP
jgi:hypothetical protein